MSRKQWCVSPMDKDLASDIAQEFDIDPFEALLLVSRGITDEEEIRTFYADKAPLIDPFELRDMDKAVERIAAAMEGNERIAVYGDYDADGVTSTALLYRYFAMNGCDVITYIPDRNTEGYGLNMRAVETLYEKGVRLIVTVDNGISAFGEAKRIRELGMDLVITDHHKASERLPEAVAVVDPHRLDCPCSYKLWSGVGVAFKLVCALSGGSDEEMLSMFADLVTIGTVGDVMPLTGENRMIVKAGLKSINTCENKGIAALGRVSGMAGKTINASGVAFSIVPRINAVGRMSHASKALDLLLSEDDEAVANLAHGIDDLNVSRQEAEKAILRQVQQQIYDNPLMLNDRVLIFSGENWHGGVIGIVAARLLNQYGKPVMVITDDGTEAKGSARSIEGFSLYDAVSSAAHLLSHYGGHTLAAGFGMKSENIPAFKQAIQDFAKSVEMPFARTELDCRLRPDFINADILPHIAALEPFGAGNPQPIFGLFAMTLSAAQSIGQGKHMRLTLKKGASTLTALLFGVTPEEFPYIPGDVLDLAVTLERNEYMGQVKVSIYIKDIRMNGTDDLKYLKSVRLYEKIKRREPISRRQAQFALADREHIARVYRFLRKNGPWNHDTDILCYRLGGDGSEACQVLVCLDVLEELGIIRRDRDSILLADTEKKVNLDDSSLLAYLRSIDE